MIAAGLMCGTSLDGIDVALLELRPLRTGYAWSPMALDTVPLTEDLAQRLREAVPPTQLPVARAARLDAAVGAAFGDAAVHVARGRRIDFVASHGVTLYHEGNAHVTWQIGDPFAIRERCGATVLCDFRRADCAAGGHGAPLVPYVDALLFASPERFRAALNLGGIANVTLIPAGATPPDVVAWDVGPGNMLLDGFVSRKTHGQERYDAGGAYAGRGRVNDDVLESLLADGYLAQRPPKSAGREQFGEAFLDAHAPTVGALSLEDGCATLTAFTAQAVADAIRSAGMESGDVIVSGGGVHNRALTHGLADRLGGMEVRTSADFGVDPDFKEAIAFAILGYELLREHAAGLPAVTGARDARLLGAIAPLGLRGLLQRVDEEVAQSTTER